MWVKLSIVISFFKLGLSRFRSEQHSRPLLRECYKTRNASLIAWTQLGSELAQTDCKRSQLNSSLYSVSRRLAFRHYKHIHSALFCNIEHRLLCPSRNMRRG